MKQHPSYIRMAQYADAHDFSDGQISNATTKQIAAILGVAEDRLPDRWLANMKKCLLAQRRRDSFTAKLQLARRQIGPHIKTLFPDCEIDFDNQGGKPFVRLWLEGKPPEPVEVSVPNG